ncbi:MAG: hypothetical protein HY721_04015 [Planctomycetes bacterium]|nr:hypothetical protein [Planctomycetota bacterium]
MSVALKGNYICVQPGQKAFKVASNFTNYLELGVAGATDYYLEAWVEGGEVFINATLVDPQAKSFCRVVNNFPERSSCRREMTRQGYRILSQSGQHLLGIELDVSTNVCHLRGTIYDAKGNVIAQDDGDDFLIHHGPAILGRSGQARGIVLE